MKSSNFNPTRLAKAILKQLIPNAGSVILALLIFWAIGVYAAPGRAPAQSAAAVPNVINYQGRLADAAGNPIDNTNPGLGMTFSLYAQQSGGSAVWSETHANTPVSQGLFSVKLGSVIPLSNDLLTGDLWLGIQVGADAEMTPREKLSAVPYAMQAGVALEVADGAVTQEKAPFAVQHLIFSHPEQNPKVSTGSYVKTLTGGSSSETLTLDISGMAFDKTPVGMVQVVNATRNGTTFAHYSYDGSNSTTASIVFFRPDGQPIGEGPIRFHLILWSN